MRIAARRSTTQDLGVDPDQGAIRRLLETRAVSSEQLFFARQRLRLWDCRATETLCSKGWIDESHTQQALAAECQTHVIDLDQAPPDFRLFGVLPPELCLRHTVVPWVMTGSQLILACAHPADIEKIRSILPTKHRLPGFVLAPPAQIQACLARLHRARLTQHCEMRTPPALSCRNWTKTHLGILLLPIAALTAALWSWPGFSLIALVMATLAILAIGTAMKIAAFVASKKAKDDLRAKLCKTPGRLPKISVLVPLFRETEIASALIRRLKRLTYPRALTDVVLVLEQKDTLTQSTLADIDLPDWMRVVVVPSGTGLTTKPRALNYALDFCKGDIVGIWDAEDAPAPDQLETIAAHFAQADPDVACVQGILDYYNPDTNWISRCFTLEYSMWFRIILRGMARIGVPIPLGGTTLFMRRDCLEQIGRWDAHNVTEDADLGIRLARFGYRTELSLTVTQEEATCRFKPWIRQRSRWLKGYMVTYLVHMRHPARLAKDIGWARVLGMNVILLAAVLQFLLAPILWLFWIVAFGMSESFGLPELPQPLINAAMVILGTALFVDMTLAIASLRGQRRARLIPWALALTLYFPMATLAAYKALIELIFAPFYWDKTTHGQTREGKTAAFSALST